MGNFDFLLKQPNFAAFANLACQAESTAVQFPTGAILGCRSAAESATKWLYTADNSLRRIQPDPYRVSFYELTSNYHFRQLIGQNISNHLFFIRKAGNEAAHNPTKFTIGDAVFTLNSLFMYMDWIDQIYGSGQAFRRFHKDLVLNPRSGVTAASRPQSAVQPTAAKQPVQHSAPAVSAAAVQAKPDADANAAQKQLKASSKSNNSKVSISQPQSALPATAKKAVPETLAEELTKRREQHASKYQAPKTDISEEETRRRFIDSRLQDAGWKIGSDCLTEYEVSGMPNAAGIGYADYVMFDNDGTPLAVIEAKKFFADPSVGRHQAMLYAECLEKKYGRKPAVFLTNGNEIILIEYGNERRVSSFYTKSDLQTLHYNYSHRQKLQDLNLDPLCRYYQIEAVNAVCERFSKGYRKALLVMATGSGKTLTVLNLIKVLCEKGWVKNVLFLADRKALVSQAFSAAKMQLKSFPLANLCADKPEDRSPGARIVFSTYQTMIGTIDENRNEDGSRLFSSGHFNLIVCDEAHRSIYNKYREIFDYFDSYLVGLTATPKDDIDINTYKVFNQDKDNPTYYYPLKKAVEDKVLVDFHTLKLNTGFQRSGIKYADLSEAEKEMWEETFADLTNENGSMITEISSGAIDNWLFNQDTIKQILDQLMTNGLKIDNGDKIGKTIIFARSHRHAEVIRDVFLQQYPYLGNEFCKVIDNQISYCENLIDQFKDPSKMPQIAVSVDMLDTGIDVPECLNLVFYKPVYSYAKFWQMIGRGTRKCPGLIDGKDKDHFLIIDACGNFEYFNTNPQGRATKAIKSLEHLTFELRLKLLASLQQSEHQEDYQAYAEKTISDLAAKVGAIPENSFQAQNHPQAVREFKQPKAYENLTSEIIEHASKELGAIIPADFKDDIRARRFDYLLYSLEYFISSNNKDRGLLTMLYKRLQAIAKALRKLQDEIPDIGRQRKWIDCILSANFLKELNLTQLEQIRVHLRDLCFFITSDPEFYKIVDFTDQLEVKEYDSDGIKKYPDENFESYEQRFKDYILEHLNEGVISKLHNNQPLSDSDIAHLELIVWRDLGSKEEYLQAFKGQNVGVLIRRTAGLSQQAAKELFAEFLRSYQLNPLQSRFINMVIEYIVKNGILERNALNEPPFVAAFAQTFDEAAPGMLQSFLTTIDKLQENAAIPLSAVAAAPMQTQVQ